MSRFKILTGILGLLIVLFSAFFYLSSEGGTIIKKTDTDSEVDVLGGIAKITESKVTEQAQRTYNEIFAELTEENCMDGVSDAVRKLFDTKGFEGIAKFPRQLQAMLPPSETEQQRHELYAYLKYGEDTEHSLWVKDEIIVKMRNMSPRPDDLIDALCSLSLDDEVNGEMRGYAAQHLRAVYDSSNDGNKEKVVGALFEGLDSLDTDVAGTNILTLAYLSENHPEEFDVDKISKYALELAENDELALTSRITAVQVCGRLGNKKSADIARQIVEDNNNVVLKLAAIATLAEVGTTDDLDILNELKTGELAVFHKAASVASEKIITRN